MNWLLRPDVLGDIGYAVVLFILLTLTRPVYLAFTKRKKGYGIVFDSISDASRHYDVDTGSVSRICRGVRGSAAGKSFIFVDSSPEGMN